MTGRNTDEEEDQEEDVGTDGRGQLVCRTQVHGSSHKFSKQTAAELSPGTVIRVSLGVRNVRGKGPKVVARMLAFVHPETGKLVVRMGMYDISKENRGKPFGPQVVHESDTPVYEVKR